MADPVDVADRPDNDIPHVLRTTEVTERLGVCDRTLRRWAAAGLLVPSRVGRTLFYRADDISALIVRQMPDVVTPPTKRE